MAQRNFPLIVTNLLTHCFFPVHQAVTLIVALVLSLSQRHKLSERSQTSTFLLPLQLITIGIWELGECVCAFVYGNFYCTVTDSSFYDHTDGRILLPPVCVNLNSFLYLLFLADNQQLTNVGTGIRNAILQNSGKSYTSQAISITAHECLSQHYLLFLSDMAIISFCWFFVRLVAN